MKKFLKVAPILALGFSLTACSSLEVVNVSDEMLSPEEVNEREDRNELADRWGRNEIGDSVEAVEIYNNMVFVSGGAGHDNEIYMLMVDDDNKLVPAINENSEVSDPTVKAYESVRISTEEGYHNEENDPRADRITVYEMDEDTVLVVQNIAVAEEGENHPYMISSFTVYDYSLEIGFEEVMHFECRDSYDNLATRAVNSEENENKVYEYTDRKYFYGIGDDLHEITSAEINEYNESAGIILGSGVMMSRECSKSAQDFHTVEPLNAFNVIFEITGRRAELPKSIDVVVRSLGDN